MTEREPSYSPIKLGIDPSGRSFDPNEHSALSMPFSSNGQAAKKDVRAMNIYDYSTQTTRTIKSKEQPKHVDTLRGTTRVQLTLESGRSINLHMPTKETKKRFVKINEDTGYNVLTKEGRKL